MTAVTVPSHCNGLGCNCTYLIRAHLVPQSFGRMIKSAEGHPNTLMSERIATTKTQHGLFDDNILCGRCDGFLNKKYDEPAYRALRKIKFAAYDFQKTDFAKPGIDGDMVCGFLLSVLWRCSISRLFEVSNVYLGGYSNPVREVLWGARAIDQFTPYKVLVQRYRASGAIEKMYSMPMPVKFLFRREAWSGFVIALVGFRFMMMLDPRPLPAEYNSFILNGSCILRGSFVDFGQTYEAQQARALIELHKPKRS
jgi:hypothetical protein